MSELNASENGNGDKNVEAPVPKDEEKSSFVNPLQMSEIVEVVMKHASVTTLKSARLVCKMWRKEANRHVFNQGYLVVPADFLGSSKKEKQSSIRLMKNFLTSISNPIQVPNIQLVFYPDLAVFDQISPTILGPRVKKLIFALYNHPDILEDLLRHRLTNLLFLDPHPIFHKEDFELPPDFCRELLQICSRVIKPPRTLTLGDLNMFVHCGKDPLCMDKFNAFSLLPNIFVQQLAFGFSAFPDDPCFPDIRTRMSGMLSRLLERNKDVLTSLKAWGSEMYWEETVVPILPQLQFFYLSIYPPRRRHDLFVPPKYNLPPKFQFSVNMPNLNEMDIFYSYNELTSTQIEDKSIPNFLAGYFDGQNPAKSVKMMTYCDFGCDFELSPVLKCFSSLQTLNYPNPGDFTKGAHSIFTWSKELKTLIIGLTLEELTSKISSFDSILTGFSQKTVDKIKNAPRDRPLTEITGAGGDFNINSLRIQPSLLDLPKLEFIYIKLAGNCLKYLPKKIFTVAGEYAFKLMPKLNVEFHLGKCEPRKCAKDALKDVAQLPNVKIVEEF